MQGKLAIVQSTLPDGTTITAIEVVRNGEEITIDDQHQPLPQDIAQLAQQIIEKVRNTYGSNNQNHVG